MKLKIGHLYPDLLELYSDRGNVLILQKRAEWRGIAAQVVPIYVGDSTPLCDFDLLLMGGGMDREQDIMAADLQRRRAELAAAVAAGTVFLGVCAGFQFLGHYFETNGGRRIPGLGLLDMYTVGAAERKVGNVVLEMELDGQQTHLFGYENRSGRTYLGPEEQPLARVLHGSGNNGEDRCEGVRKGTIYGTYLHGPILAKNPQFADHLLTEALRRQNPGLVLPALDDSFETRTREKLFKRFVGAR